MTKTTPCSVETSDVRDVLGCIADKWTFVVIDELGESTLRFAELQRAIGGISQKVLTQTLRGMERNGFVHREVFPEVPPRVQYTLTEMGRTLGEAMCGLWQWTDAHYPQVQHARAGFDGALAARVER
jgi:DNA-binding HxlR family transcriptional regulator